MLIDDKITYHTIVKSHTRPHCSHFERAGIWACDLTIFPMEEPLGA